MGLRGVLTNNFSLFLSFVLFSLNHMFVKRSILAHASSYAESNLGVMGFMPKPSLSSIHSSNASPKGFHLRAT